MTEAAVELDEEASGVVKKFMYVNRKAPYGTIYALEGLEVVLISAAFDQDVSLAFLDDGVYQLLEQDGLTINNNKVSNYNEWRKLYKRKLILNDIFNI